MLQIASSISSPTSDRIRQQLLLQLTLLLSRFNLMADLICHHLFCCFEYLLTCILNLSEDYLTVCDKKVSPFPRMLKPLQTFQKFVATEACRCCEMAALGLFMEKELPFCFCGKKTLFQLNAHAQKAIQRRTCFVNASSYLWYCRSFFLFLSTVLGLYYLVLR